MISKGRPGVLIMASIESLGRYSPPLRRTGPFLEPMLPIVVEVRMQIKRSLLIVCALLATSADAIAQAPPKPATPPQQTAPPPPQPPMSCERMGSGSGGANAPRDSTVGQSHEPLGDRLARSDGVLCPPSGVDPEIRAPTPDTGGKMPVIPPPGSPGGDPNLRPK